MFALNNRGQTAGEYSDSTGIHGFVDTNGSFATIDFPGANDTHVRGINDRGQITGSYTLPTTGRQTYGFLDDNGTFSSINGPGANGTFPAGINDLGQIVGVYGGDTGLHGFIESGGTFTNVDVPSVLDTRPASINNFGLITGIYETVSGDVAIPHSFLATPRFAYGPASTGADNPAPGIQDLAQLLTLSDQSTARDLWPLPAGIAMPPDGAIATTPPDPVTGGIDSLTWLDTSHMGTPFLTNGST